jgi:hypothetical protein
MTLPSSPILQPDDVPVGGIVFIRPLIRDAFGNAAADGGALSIDVVGPERVSYTPQLVRSTDGGVPSVEARFEPVAIGMRSRLSHRPRALHTISALFSHRPHALHTNARARQPDGCAPLPCVLQACIGWTCC